MMLPWEREIYVDMLIQHIKEENDKIREQERQRRGQTCQRDYQIKQQAQSNGYGGF